MPITFIVGEGIAFVQERGFGDVVSGRFGCGHLEKETIWRRREKDEVWVKNKRMTIFLKGRTLV